MIQLERSLDLNRSPDMVWAELSRFMHINDIAPEVTSVDALSENETGVGAKRRCHFANGSSMVEEVTEWNEGQSYRVRATDMGAMPLYDMQAGIAVTAAGEGSRVAWSVDYRVKYGPLGWLMGQTLMKGMMGKFLDGNLRGLAAKVQSAATAGSPAT